MSQDASMIKQIRRKLRLRQRMKNVFNRFLRRVGFLKKQRSDGLQEELLGWENLLKEEGRYWVRSEYQKRLDPEWELQQELKQLIQVPPDLIVRILDVGAGPLTHLGKIWKGTTLKLFPLDPLAEEYKSLLSRMMINPPMFTEYGDGEKLLDQFGQNYFDLACAHNSLDHSENPLLAIKQMLAVVKPGSYVYLKHFHNEGLNEAYKGLHQWNFCIKDNDMILSNGRGINHSLAAEFRGMAELQCEQKFQMFNNNRAEWAIAKLKKIHPG